MRFIVSSFAYRPPKSSLISLLPDDVSKGTQAQCSPERDGELLASAILDFHNICGVVYRAIDCDLVLLGYLNPCATPCGIGVARRVGTIFGKVRSTPAKRGFAPVAGFGLFFRRMDLPACQKLERSENRAGHAQENLSLGCPWPLTLP